MQPIPAAWPPLAGLPARPLHGGLINATFAVGEPPVAVVQRLHPIFAPPVNEDIDAVTTWIASRGLATPRLLRTADGAASVQQDGCWRALTWVPGVSLDRLETPAQAAEAGRLVARWHAAVDGLEHDFAFTRPGAHDTSAHMARLAAALDAQPQHRLRDAVGPVADALIEAWRTWDGRLDAPLRLCHGDLKISNLRFDEDGRGVCLLDLDTMAWMPLDIELGDAWRSWCNPQGEDAAAPRFALELFEASAAAYVAQRPLAGETREALPAGVERIALELASRFAADALHESYFGWRSEVAPTRGDHNLLRARGQLALAQQVRAARRAMERALVG